MNARHGSLTETVLPNGQPTSRRANSIGYGALAGGDMNGIDSADNFFLDERLPDSEELYSLVTEPFPPRSELLSASQVTPIPLALELKFTGLLNSTCVSKPCTVINRYTGSQARSGKMVAEQLSSRSLNAFSDGASATDGGSLFHGPTTRTKNAACRRVS